MAGIKETFKSINKSVDEIEKKESKIFNVEPKIKEIIHKVARGLLDKLLIISS